MLRRLLIASLFLAGCSQTVHYVSSRKSDVFHRSTCSEVGHIKSENLQSLGDERSAAAKDRRACDVCKP
ncbi:hypothetical protein JST97_16450 [bacterium]|nr:hypothetical protein [bacterium]